MKINERHPHAPIQRLHIAAAISQWLSAQAVLRPVSPSNSITEARKATVLASHRLNSFAMSATYGALDNDERSGAKSKAIQQASTIRVSSPRKQLPTLLCA